MTVWVIRAGRHGEREQWCLENGIAGGGWDEVGDLTAASGRDEVRALLEAAMPNATSGLVANHAGQLWALRNIEPGDLVILPLKSKKAIAIGVCTQGYQYRADAPLKHTISVDWKRDDVPRSAIKDDLLYTLGAIMTIFRASRNNATERFKAVLETGVDPGSTGVRPAPAPQPSPRDDNGDLTDPVVAPTLETIRDRVRSFVSENFKGHRFTELVAEVLRARGFVCEVSPPGPDQGVDILAGSGALGLDSPTLIVEVKSEGGQVSAPVVRGLHGAISSHASDQGLLVAWGGITKDARREMRTDRFKIRVWDADEFLDQFFAVYDDLPEETRRLVPLKQAWVLDEEAG